MFADILLPLPIVGTFTYAIPDSMPQPERGSRVIVQFGNKKYHTGIVTDIHANPPGNYEVKEIMAVLDPNPVVRYPQLKFWNWIADYYLCTPGEVMRAALPSGLKIGSESFVGLGDSYDADADLQLTETQANLIQLLEHNGPQRIADLEGKYKLERPQRDISRLAERGLVCVGEKSVERYKPKKITCVELCCDRDDRDTLHGYFDLVSRSQRQEKVLVAYLDLSRWLNRSAQRAEVTKEELMSKSGATQGIIKALVDKKILRVFKKPVNRFADTSGVLGCAPSPLSAAQAKAYSEVTESMRSNAVTLLHGVTGSGKTEIYTHLIRQTLDSGRSVLYLVPEISLTTQLTDRLRRVFGKRLLVYHSKFSDNERVDIWRQVLTSPEPVFVLGVRSSVFLPFGNLGLVIVDEEHEASFKQYDPAPRYNARDAAIVLASMHGARTLLGSATPSVETYYKATNGKYGLVTLSERFEGAVMPDVEIVDMREQRKKKLARGSISAPLGEATRHALQSGRQAIMFQNRRGFAPVVVCRECGWTPKCRNCDVSPVYHKNSHDLRCHYCGSVEMLPALCPACGQNSIDIFGYGTERIAEEMHSYFEGYRVARMDLDTTRSRDAYQEIIEEFAKGDTDILVGTQMVSKGLDFEKVNVVGVINADTLLNFPDFRSSERAFNMLEQVAGRAGRRKEKGKVIIQTTDPQNDVLRYVRAHDYTGYYRDELEDRRKFAYPPFTRVINIYLKHRDAATLDRLAVAYTLHLRKIFGDRVLGPERPFVARVANYHLQSVMLKVESNASMRKVKEILRDIYTHMASDPQTRQLILYFDVDPV